MKKKIYIYVRVKEHVDLKENERENNEKNANDLRENKL